MIRRLVSRHVRESPYLMDVSVHVHRNGDTIQKDSRKGRFFKWSRMADGDSLAIDTSEHIGACSQPFARLDITTIHTLHNKSMSSF